tara:strand:+ start:1732 stop:2631 length:900 start_codon:yes stop_codon:yes gene_type:complete
MKKAYIYSGQGSQYIGMDQLFNNYSNHADKYFKISKEILGYDIEKIINNGPTEKLNNTKYTQPAIFIISAIADTIYKAKFGSADCCAGHSLGEITALYSSNVLSFEDALLLIQKRAESMDEAGKVNPGGMIALINANQSQINLLLNNTSISIANINSNKQIILSGSIESIKASISLCKEEKIKALKLPVSGAFHSHLMQSASDALLKTINHLNFKDANIPIYQNYNALPTQDKDLIKTNLIKQITCPVLWKNIIDSMIKDKVEALIEIGPKKVLTGINKTMDLNSEYNSFEDLIQNESI